MARLHILLLVEVVVLKLVKVGLGHGGGLLGQIDTVTAVLWAKGVMSINQQWCQ